jgi:hypothetical protein
VEVLCGEWGELSSGYNFDMELCMMDEAQTEITLLRNLLKLCNYALLKHNRENFQEIYLHV